MQYPCVGAIFVGALVLSYGLLDYYSTLKFMQEQSYDQKLFTRPMYRSTFLMMVFFLCGYLVVGTLFFLNPYEDYYVMVSLIFLAGSVFVLFMVKVQRRMATAISEKTFQTIQAMVRAIEAKDIYTRGHSEHVRNLSLLIVERLPETLKHEICIPKLADAAMLHDIGKIGIPDAVLNKPGKLTPEEFEVVKLHPKNGKTILEKTCYHDVCDWILYHHEHMDGKGYYGLSGSQIPLESRIIALADVFSALYTERVYRSRFSYPEAIAIVRKESGTVLDPLLVDLFCGISEEEINRASVF